MILKGFIVAASAALFATTPHKEITVASVDEALQRAEIQHHEIVLRQTIWETKWFTCEYCSLEGNNIFGFRKNHDYINFQCWEDGVNYYKEWQDRYYNGGSYYDFLVNIGYASSETYTTDLQSLSLP